MADAYWRFGDARQPASAAAAAAALPSLLAKRARSDYDTQGGREVPGYYTLEDDRTGLRAIRDTDTINATYDRYLRSSQISTYGGDSGRAMTSGLAALHPLDDPRLMAMVGADPSVAGKRQAVGVGGRAEIPLPPDASSTLFVEGLPANCTRREVSHIFRPFVGYKEVRLVTKESRHSGGDPLVLCFVDFVSPAHAATAMDALQGYEFDEHDRESAHLRLQFARYPGARSGGGHRGRR